MRSADMEAFAEDFDFDSYPNLMKNLLWKLLQWPNELKSIESTLKIHRLTHYLYELSKEFHSIWTEGKTNRDYRWLFDDDYQKKLPLLKLFKSVMHTGLEILGIQSYESMHNEKDI
jgi:arginyl-tRNA synthetase